MIVLPQAALFAPPGGGGGAAPVLEHLLTSTTAGIGGTVWTIGSFGGLIAAKRIILRGRIQVNGSGAKEYTLRPNGATTGYQGQRTLMAGTTVTGNTVANQWLLGWPQATGSGIGAVEFVTELHYAAAFGGTFFRSWAVHQQTGPAATGLLSHGVYPGSGDITTLDVVSGGANEIGNSEVQLYSWKD